MSRRVLLGVILGFVGLVVFVIFAKWSDVEGRLGAALWGDIFGPKVTTSLTEGSARSTLKDHRLNWPPGASFKEGTLESTAPYGETILRIVFELKGKIDLHQIGNSVSQVPRNPAPEGSDSLSLWGEGDVLVLERKGQTVHLMYAND